VTAESSAARFALRSSATRSRIHNRRKCNNAALMPLGVVRRATRACTSARRNSANVFLLLPEAGFLGLNCTIPHKAAVLAAVDPRCESLSWHGG
jgi:shikimate 5-dehydrogenase